MTFSNKQIAMMLLMAPAAVADAKFAQLNMANKIKTTASAVSAVYRPIPARERKLEEGDMPVECIEPLAGLDAVLRDDACAGMDEGDMDLASLCGDAGCGSKISAYIDGSDAPDVCAPFLESVNMLGDLCSGDMEGMEGCDMEVLAEMEAVEKTDACAGMDDDADMDMDEMCNPNGCMAQMVDIMGRVGDGCALIPTEMQSMGEMMGQMCSGGEGSECMTKMMQMEEPVDDPETCDELYDIIGLDCFKELAPMMSSMMDAGSDELMLVEKCQKDLNGDSSGTAAKTGTAAKKGKKTPTWDNIDPVACSTAYATASTNALLSEDCIAKITKIATDSAMRKEGEKCPDVADMCEFCIGDALDKLAASDSECAEYMIGMQMENPVEVPIPEGQCMMTPTLDACGSDNLGAAAEDLVSNVMDMYNDSGSPAAAPSALLAAGLAGLMMLQ